MNEILEMSTGQKIVFVLFFVPIKGILIYFSARLVRAGWEQQGDIERERRTSEPK